MPYLYLGQWNWGETDSSVGWRMPREDIGIAAFDLRSLPQRAKKITPEGYGLFLLSEPDSIGIYLGDSWGSLVKPPLKRGLKSALSLGENIVASDPLAILLELINNHADPTGQARWKPLRGTKLILAKQVLWSGARNIFNEILVFQADYRRNRANGMPLETLQRWTGATMLKLWGRMSDELAAQLLPPEFVNDGWTPPATTITDNFTRADADALGTSSEGWSWTEILGDTDIVTNRARGTTTSSNRNRAGQALSSDDHYSQIVMAWQTGDATNSYGKAIVRMDSTDIDTYYYGHIRRDAGGYEVWQFIDGSGSVIASATIASGDHTVKMQADGSSIDLIIDTVSQGPWTDNGITGYLFTGAGTTRALTFDDFEAADLAAGPTEQAVGGASLSIAGTLSRTSNFYRTIGQTSMTPSSSLSKLISTTVGGASMAITGAVSKLIGKAVGQASMTIAGALSAAIVLTVAVGGGAVTIASSVSKLISKSVGGGSVSISSSLGWITEWVILQLRQRSLALTLQVRGLALNLRNRGLALTVQIRNIASTLWTRITDFTLKRK